VTAADLIARAYRPRFGLGGFTRLVPKHQVELSWVLIGQFFATVGSLVGVRILTTYLRPQVYGDVALAMTVATFLQLLVMGPIGQGSLRFLAVADEQNEIAPYVRAVANLCGYATGLIALIGATLVVFVRWTRWSDATLLLASVCVYGIVVGIGSVLDGVQNAARHRAVVAWHQGAGQWLRIFVTLLTIQVWGATATHVIAAYTFAAAIVLVSQVLLFKRRIASSPWSAPSTEGKTRRWESTIAKYSLPFAAWAIFAWLQSSSDRWSLGYWGGRDDVGVYAALFQLGYGPAVLLSGIVVQLVSPIVFARAGDGSDTGRLESARRLTNDIVKLSLVATVALSFTSAFVSRQIFAVLVGPEYRQGAVFLPLMILAGGVFAAGQIAAINAMSEGKTAALMKPKIGTAAVAIALNAAAASAGGFAGVVYALVAASFVYFGWVLLL
jgi:O-antigen/teichoic acid export membrane protein